MKIAHKLKNLLVYYDATRGVGHTETMLYGVGSNKHCIVLVQNLGAQKQYILDKLQVSDPYKMPTFVSINSFDDTKLIGHRSPLVIDNSVLISLFQESLNAIYSLERSLEKLTQENDNTTKTLSKLSVDHGKLMTSYEQLLEKYNKLTSKIQNALDDNDNIDIE